MQFDEKNVNLQKIVFEGRYNSTFCNDMCQIGIWLETLHTVRERQQAWKQSIEHHFLRTCPSRIELHLIPLKVNMTILGIEHVGTEENHEDMVVEIDPLEILRTKSK